ncbi:MAG: LuxR C-terminal-related transcriptional regulator [Myxococcaceae bacterium]
MSSKLALLDCLDAAYRMDLDGAAYVKQMADRAAELIDHGLGVLAYTYELKDGAAVIDHRGTSERLRPEWLAKFYGSIAEAGVQRGRSSSPFGYQTWQHLQCSQASAVAGMKPLMPFFAHLGGAKDIFAINAFDASGRGLWLGAGMPAARKVPRERIELFTRFAAHLTSAVRMRRTGVTKGKPAAVLSPRGALLDAQGPETVEARAELQRATLAFDAARVRKSRADAGGVMREWRPLVISRWSLLDDFDSDGKRFVVAVENGPPTRPPRRDLSEREHQVLTQAHLGHSNKVIAYELGLSSSTVRVLLHRAAKKLGATTRAGALERFAKLAKSERLD